MFSISILDKDEAQLQASGSFYCKRLYIPSYIHLPSFDYMSLSIANLP